VTEGREVAAILVLVTLATTGVIVGTLFGRRVLRVIPETRFRTFVAALIGVLGTVMMVKGFGA